MADYPATPKATIKFNDYIRVVNGSVCRPITPPTTAASPNPTTHIPVLSKDITINPDKNLWVRLFLPRHASFDAAGAASKLPLIVYFHGSGFVICSAADTVFHDLCANMAFEIGAVVVSVGYRLAPEHRLPAAYEDGVEALHWIKGSGEAWLSAYADVSRCYLMGSSAGGNLAYFAALRVADCVGDLEPLKIRGLILHHALFGGVRRSGSEVRLENDSVLPLSATDMMWELALPEGADRDHEYSNPMANKGSEHCSKMRRVGWKVLVTGCEGDLLHDRQVELVDMLKGNGVEVEAEFGRGDGHAIELYDSSKAKALFGRIKNFVA